MFFHRETPGLRDRRAEIVLQVREVLEKKCIPRMPPGEHVKYDQHVIRGPDAEHASHNEAACVDVACFGVLPQQQSAHQKAAQGKEEIDALSPEAL